MSNLSKLGIFKWINIETVNEIVSSAPEKEFTSGEVILIEETPSNWKWYIIKSWKVEVSIKWKKITELGIWNIFWEIALLNEENRTATVKTIENTTVIILSLDDLINMINNDNNSINKQIINRIEENLER